MCSDPGGLSLLDRRRIEALVLGPMIRALQRELGGERAAAIARRVIEEIAKEQGGALRARVGRGDLKAFAESRTASRADGALEVTVLACRRDRYEFDVTRCR
ncbi:MAG: L-2-amino-thiazoline-4-carboxylic acid hydrolase, partial [Gemmatimonadetes bacterium]|nr:L-2-amino-thiazoline-4-carboxylic acid hydrolase [Gemmatimonadota bacterium]